MLSFTLSSKFPLDKLENRGAPTSPKLLELGPQTLNPKLPQLASHLYKGPQS